MAVLSVSVSDPAAPVAVEVAEPVVPGSEPVTDRSAVSPAAASTHSFCRVIVAEVRVLLTVQVTGTGVAGTANVPPCPSASGVSPGWSHAIWEV